MAQKVVTIYTDDLTGEESSEVGTHTFCVDGVFYEIDLIPDSFDKLMDALRPFMESGRKMGRKKSGGARRPAPASDVDTAAIRSWAKENGFEVNDRGRVPANVREAYDQAH
ncbi:Lsr2 family protein [Streptomyces sp. B6B3]|uniref:histone-like nucleoid-structuring protein Lsr2 n=1 Tax=Streptomyces sp. B6B3 TaxID=3153570 RepID=UPI00325EAB4D